MGPKRHFSIALVVLLTAWLPTAMARQDERTQGSAASRRDVRLAMSGGGYRAMLFHLGALRRLDELSYLRRLERVSSVSGGSITAAVLAIQWDERGTGAPRLDLVENDLLRLASLTLDVRAFFRGAFRWGVTRSGELERFYAENLFGDKTLGDLPEIPMFWFNATNLDTGGIWRFSRAFSGEPALGRVLSPTTPLSRVVAASSAFPAAFSSVEHTPTKSFSEGPGDWSASDFEAGRRGEGYQWLLTDLRKRQRLVDGGVADNLGLESVWTEWDDQVLFVSDGSARLKPTSETLGMVEEVKRAIDIQGGAAADARVRRLIEGYQQKEGVRGAYWSMHFSEWGKKARCVVSHCLNKELESALYWDWDRLAGIDTRLSALRLETKRQLINFGYLACEVALGAYYPQYTGANSRLPYPSESLGVTQTGGVGRLWSRGSGPNSPLGQYQDCLSLCRGLKTDAEHALAEYYAKHRLGIEETQGTQQWTLRSINEQDGQLSVRVSLDADESETPLSLEGARVVCPSPYYPFDWGDREPTAVVVKLVVSGNEGPAIECPLRSADN